MITRAIILRRATWAMLALGVALRIWQYASDTSMWWDELSIARNIAERSLSRLILEPLAYQQIAPVGFVAALKVSTIVVGPSDLALRIYPFVCGLAALFLLWRVALTVLDDAGALIAVTLFAIALPLIRYTAELKQYGGDAAATLALVLLTLRLRSATPTVRRCVLTGLAGVALGFFSQTSLMGMTGLGMVLVVCWLRERTPDSLRPAAITVPIWAVGTLAAFWVAVSHTTPEQRAYMHHFWGQRNSFFPWPPQHGSDVFWLWRQVVPLFGENGMLEYPFAAFYAALAVFGLITLWWRRRDAAAIVVAPFVVTVAAAVAQQYPFRLRVVVFLIPTLLLLVAAAIEWLYTEAAHVRPALGAAVAATLVAPPILTIVTDRPPYFIEDYKSPLAFVQAHRLPGDKVFVYANTFDALNRYGPRYGIAASDYTLGSCNGHDNRRYLEEVDQFRGARRLWYIASSVPPFYPARHSIDRYLHAIGVQRDSIAIPSRQRLSPVSAELFDLSDTTRLQAVSAATFDVTPINDTLPPECNDRVRPTAPHAPDHTP